MQLRKLISILILLVCIRSGHAQSDLNSTIITKINIQGNNRTQREIILRELTIEPGVDYSKKNLPRLIEQNRLQILKTSLFNFAEIKLDQPDSSQTELTITVQERWYYIPRFRMKTVEENINAWFSDKNFTHITAALTVTDENFRGRNEKLTLSGSMGYNKSVGITYFRPSIFNFKHIGIGADIQWSSNKEVSYGLFDYKPRYYRSANTPLIRNFQGALQLYYRPNLAIDELFTIAYHYTQFNDSLRAQNRIYYPNKSQHLIRLTSKFKADFRNNKAYPTTGSYFDLIAEKVIDIKSSDQSVDFSMIAFNARYYKFLFPKTFIAIGGTFMGSRGNDYMPAFSRSIGQSGYEIRSFEHYLLPVRNVAIVRTTLKYQLLNAVRFNIPRLNNPKFGIMHYAIYATLFADGSAIDLQREANYEQQLQINNMFLYSVGAGLDYSTYYDLVLRTEYSYNFVLKKYVFAIHFKSSI
jgi:outer membrane protein assembly factor BamA